jgi:hypothetical protein
MAFKQSNPKKYRVTFGVTSATVYAENKREALKKAYTD